MTISPRKTMNPDDETERPLLPNVFFTGPDRIDKEYTIDESEAGLTALGATVQRLVTKIFHEDGTVNLAAILFCKRHPTRIVDPGGIFMIGVRAHAEEQAEVFKDMFAAAIRGLSTFGGADAAVFLSEIWLSNDPAFEGKGASNDPARKEALFAVIQTKSTKRVHIGTITRHPPKGASVTWESLPPNIEAGGRFHDLLGPIEIPASMAGPFADVLAKEQAERGRERS
jgi:hypothetical protein